MAFPLDVVYGLAHQCRVLERACDARTLTNNPAAPVVQAVEDAAAIMAARMGAQILGPADAVVSSADLVALKDSTGGSAGFGTVTVVDGIVTITLPTAG